MQRKRQGAVGPQYVQGDSSRSPLQLYLTLLCSQCLQSPRPVLPTPQILQKPAQSPRPLTPRVAAVPWVRRTLGVKRCTVE